MTLGKILLIGFLLLSISIFDGEAKVLDETCTPPATGVTDECSVDNSECKPDKCVCIDGFIKENGACPKALDQTCTDTNECVTNSKCDGDDGSKTCTCNDGYFNKEGLCSKAVSGIDCGSDKTACDTIGNAVCDTETSNCKCEPDYIMNGDKCDPKNAATTIGFGAMSLALLLSAASFSFVLF
ncbi:adhesion G protein-coupled receptor E1-like [Ruditapes philippinarum]|uniref:adhesion G protein-coupled receptor E1-like n=1 Tax=Ruditapes philippinarum TaxID=129788 RepID=UPI00295BEF39|nr:adhesion G protein-coupled receptor E1-like [Ruditapes philippinarum]